MESIERKPKLSPLDISRSMRARDPDKPLNEAETRSIIEISRIQVREATGSRLILPGLNLLDASVELAYHTLDKGPLPGEDITRIIRDRQTVLNSLLSLDYYLLKKDQDKEDYLRALSSSASLAMIFMLYHLKDPEKWKNDSKAIGMVFQLFNSGISSLQTMCELHGNSQTPDEAKGLYSEVFGLVVLLNQQRMNSINRKQVETVRLSTLAEDSGTLKPEFNADLIISGARIQVKASKNRAEDDQSKYRIPVAYPEYAVGSIDFETVSCLLEAVCIIFKNLCEIPEQPDQRLDHAKIMLNKAKLVFLGEDRKRMSEHIGKLATSS